jgi:hypothetical protein
MKKITFLLLFVATTAFAQTNLNEYKYIIVPTKFDFQKKENQYRINTITKLLFVENGFTAVYENNMPEDLRKNGCLGLRSNLVNTSGMFSTKLKVELKDCNGNVVFTSAEGKSKIKQYEPAYNEALRRAFNSFKAINYTYQPKEETMNTSIVSSEEPNPKKEEGKTVSFENDVKETQSKKIVEVPFDKSTEIKESTTSISGMLYAQPIAVGYQLVDSTPKIRFVLQKSSRQNIFIVKKGGIVYLADGKWMYENYINGNLVSEELNIKF